jgi:hypothetical protein
MECLANRIIVRKHILTHKHVFILKTRPWPLKVNMDEVVVTSSNLIKSYPTVVLRSLSYCLSDRLVSLGTTRLILKTALIHGRK